VTALVDSRSLWVGVVADAYQPFDAIVYFASAKVGIPPKGADELPAPWAFIHADTPREA
jgi:hypothetical protein